MFQFKKQLSDTKARKDTSCPVGCEERTLACMQTRGFGGKHVIFTPLTTMFNFFKSYLDTSLSLPTATLVHSSSTVMYQENLQHEIPGLDVILYFCSYHREKNQIGLCSLNSI